MPRPTQHGEYIRYDARQQRPWSVQIQKVDRPAYRSRTFNTRDEAIQARDEYFSAHTLSTIRKTCKIKETIQRRKTLADKYSHEVNILELVKQLKDVVVRSRHFCNEYIDGLREDDPPDFLKVKEYAKRMNELNSLMEEAINKCADDDIVFSIDSSFFAPSKYMTHFDHLSRGCNGTFSVIPHVKYNLNESRLRWKLVHLVKGKWVNVVHESTDKHGITKCSEDLSEYIAIAKRDRDKDIDWYPHVLEFWFKLFEVYDKVEHIEFVEYEKSTDYRAINAKSQIDMLDLHKFSVG